MKFKFRKSKVLLYVSGLLCVALIGGCSSDSEPSSILTEPTIAIVVTTDATETTTIPTTEAVTEAVAEPTIASTTEPTTEPTTAPTAESTETEPEGRNYVLNTNSRKFHYPNCSSADDIKASNRKDVVATREDLIAQGYDPCGRCHP